jgi:hypothetical protein
LESHRGRKHHGYHAFHDLIPPNRDLAMPDSLRTTR